jgi:AcrR family transcriptional regulator
MIIMADKRDKNTEENIITAAERVFIDKGMDGARMQHIADEAGINKALLHYYYRSKQKLFSIVFTTAFKAFAPDLLKVFQEEGDFFSQLRKFVKAYLDVLEKNPHIPGFILHEIRHKPDKLVKLVGGLNLNIDIVIRQIEDEIEKGNMMPIDPKQLLIHIISLCIFPIVAKPMLTAVIFKTDGDACQKALNERKDLIADFIINSIKL